MKNRLKYIVPLVLMSFLSVACGSSGGGNTSGGIGGTGISKGTIEGFGSVIVNGVKFNTDGATFTVDDQPGSQNDLAVGMVVEVDINDDGTTANHVEFESEVEGPVDARDDNNHTLTVLGRTVIVDDNTKIEDTAGNALPFNTLVTDDQLEVSGLVFSDDRVHATHIQRQDAQFIAGLTEVELKGTVSALDTIPDTFIIGTQTVHYSGATFTRMTAADLANGLFVEVKGTRDGSGILQAATIDKEDGFGPGDGLQVEIEGLVTAFTSGDSFSVNGQPVSTSSLTVYEDGAKDDIALNVRLEVEGTISGGVLAAKKVQFRGNRIKIEANVESKSTSGPNTVTIFGIPVRINTATSLEDDSSIKDPDLTFADIQVGERLELRGYLTGTGTERVVVATRVEREDLRSDVRLQAPVDLVANPDLVLAGVTVNTSSTLVFKDRNDNLISATTFFGQVKAGDLVKAKGTLSGTEILAEEVEFEG